MTELEDLRSQAARCLRLSQATLDRGLKSTFKLLEREFTTKANALEAKQREAAAR